MQHLNTSQPDIRLMQRLINQIRSPHCTPSAWVSAGEALALAILNTRDVNRLPLWADDLADTMVGALLRILDRSVNDSSDDQRVALAVAAVTLSIARPHTTVMTDAAVAAWLGWGIGRPGKENDPAVLAAWTQLHLFRRDTDGAAETVTTLLDRQPHGVGLILHDWTVACIQSHGPEREAQNFHHLRAVLPLTSSLGPGFLLVAAATATQAALLPRARVMTWLREVASELASDGTARATPMSARQR